MLAIEAASASPEPPRRFIDASKRPPLYFVHIPKTGGTSLRSYLLDQYTKEDPCPTDQWKEFCLMGDEERAPYRVFFGHPLTRPRDFGSSDMRMITFLRDPLARSISAVRHNMRKPEFLKRDPERKLTLRDMIYDKDFMEKLHNQMCRLLSVDTTLADVRMRLNRHKGDLAQFTPRLFAAEPTMKNAMRTVERCDFVGLTERYEDSLLGMAAKFTYMPPQAMPMLNRASDFSSEKDEAEFRSLSKADLDHVRGLLDEDYKLYAEIERNWNPGHGGFDAICRDLIASKVISPITRPMRLDLGRPFAGSGWYDPEEHENRTVRWSGPKNTALLPLPLSRHRPWQIDLSFKTAVPDAVVTLYVDGIKAAPQTIQKNSETIARFAVPPRLNTPVTTLVIECSALKRPDHPNDRRLLGVLLTGVRVF